MALVDHNGEAEFPVNKDKVFDAICIAIPTIKGLSIESSDKFSGRVVVKGGVSLASWGENIPIQLTEIDENRTRVSIISSPKTGVLFGGMNDMGKNRKNIESILLRVSQVLQAGQTTYPTQQAINQQSTFNKFQQPAKKKTSLGKKILFGVGILIVIGIVANSGGSKPTPTTETTSTETVKEKKWTEVFTFKGSGMKKSASFHLSGAKTRIQYKFKTHMGLFTFYVVPEGQDILKEGGIPEVMTQQSEASETYITKDEGEYYLNVNSSGGDWVIIIEEEK